MNRLSSRFCTLVFLGLLIAGPSAGQKSGTSGSGASGSGSSGAGSTGSTTQTPPAGTAPGYPYNSRALISLSRRFL